MRLENESFFYLGDNEERHGPLDAASLGAMLLDGSISGDTPIWSKGLGEWQEMCNSDLVCWMAERSTPSQASAPWFYLNEAGEQQGPAHTDQLRDLYSGGAIDLDCAVWSKALGEWQRIRDVAALMLTLTPSPA